MKKQEYKHTLRTNPEKMSRIEKKKTNQNCMYEWKCNQKCEKKASTKDITDEKSNVYHFCQISTVAIVDFRLSAQTKLLTRF